MDQEVQMNTLAYEKRVRNDLKSKLHSFPKTSEGLEVISKHTNVSKRTFQRIIQGSHKPTTNTVIRFYQYLLQDDFQTSLIDKLPAEVREHIFKDSLNVRLTTPTKTLSLKVDELIVTDSVFREIYLLNSVGEITKEYISYRFGQYGVDVIEKMLKLKVIIAKNHNTFISGFVRAQLGNEAIVAIGKGLVEHKLQKEKLSLRGENSASVYFQAIDTETYNELLKIEHEHMSRKKELLSMAKKGNVKMWTFSCTDTMDESCIYDDHRVTGRIQ